MTEFVLIDLNTQYDKVMEFIEGMTEEEVLDWMNNYGITTRISNPYDSKLYSFQSDSGIVTGFRFDETGKIVVFHK